MIGVPRKGRQRGMKLLIGSLMVAVLIVVNGPPLVSFATQAYHNWLINTSSYKRKYGHWSILTVPRSMRINAVHAILLNTGKVLIMAGSGNSLGAFNAGHFESIVWNPTTDSFKKIPTPYDMFCSGHLILPDGKVLIAGGTSRYEVMAPKVKYAAGVITITNRSPTARFQLPAGTSFQSPFGQRYRSIAAVTIGPARRAIGPGGRRIVTPSSSALWVKAVTAGDSSVLKTAEHYTVVGASPAGETDMEATAPSLTRQQQDFGGTRHSYLFDPQTERYERVADMNIARWYPTLVGLQSGKVLAVSGLDQFGRIVGGNPEAFDPRTKTWQLEPNLRKSFPTYPALFLMPNGKLLYTGSSAGYGPLTPAWRDSGVWNPQTDAFRAIPGMRVPTMTETSGSLLLPPAQAQRYAIIGGGGVGDSNRSTGRIDIVNLNARRPRWQPAGSLPVGTRYPEAVITPNDGVVISGGSRGYRGEHSSDIFECHLFDPRTNRLTRLADPLVGRDYHAEALLLPDGRILTLGGNPLFGNEQDSAPEYFEQRIAIFSPPYLYRGTRPRLAGGPTELSRGQTAVFATPDPAAITKARLIHPSAVTHVTDVQQRSIALKLTRGHESVALTIPRGSGLVPPGWYMVFVDNHSGVPSVARWVHIR